MEQSDKKNGATCLSSGEVEPAVQKKRVSSKTVRANIEKWAKHPRCQQAIMIDAFFAAGGHDKNEVSIADFLMS